MIDRMASNIFFINAKLQQKLNMQKDYQHFDPELNTIFNDKLQQSWKTINTHDGTLWHDEFFV